MIATEIITINGRQLVRTYSTENRYVVRDGIAYDEAIDPIDSGREYTEGDIKPIDEIELKAQAYDIITGVSE